MFSTSFGGNYSDALSLTKLQRPNISYDTSSKDPQMLRSRIFVGGLNTNTVSRDDVIQLFSSYGTILGVTLFKGYAFVQYSNMNEADLAVSALNLYHWHGSALDVKIVAKDQKFATPISVSSGNGNLNGTTGKRPAQTDHTNEAKKTKPHNSDLQYSSRIEFPDLFICGECRFTTSCFETFVNHRKIQCDAKSGRKMDDEPEYFECFTCSEKFVTSWELLQHLSKFHNLAVYRDALFANSVEKEIKTEV